MHNNPALLHLLVYRHAIQNCLSPNIADLPVHTTTAQKCESERSILYSYLGLMEAAEGETVKSTVAARRDGSRTIKEHTVRAVGRRVSDLRPWVRGVTSAVQHSAIRIVVASTDIPQRRKGN